MIPSLRLLAIAVAAASLVSACAPKQDSSADAGAGLESDAQKFGYALGYDLGKQLEPLKEDTDLAALKAGLDDAVGGKDPKLDDAARDQIKNTVDQRMRERLLKQREDQAVKNKEEGEKFLAENAKREGVKTTASGLQYEVITEGKGEHPKASDTVTVNYVGTLLNGEEFDNSYKRGQALTMPLNGFIPGWTEGVQLMTPGSKYKFYIPSSLAYGERGAGVKMGPNQTLVFEVELLSIGEPKEDAK